MPGTFSDSPGSMPLYLEADAINPQSRNLTPCQQDKASLGLRCLPSSQPFSRQQGFVQSPVFEGQSQCSMSTDGETKGSNHALDTR